MYIENYETEEEEVDENNNYKNEEIKRKLSIMKSFYYLQEKICQDKESYPELERF